MSYNPNNANGQAASAASAPVVISSDQSAVPILSGVKEVSFTTTTVQAVGATDASNYAWIAVHIVTQGGTSTVTFQTSNDNTNWVSQVMEVSTGGATAGASSTTNASVIYHGPRMGRYFRLNVTGIVSGTTAGVIEFYANPSAMQSLGVVAGQTGTWTVGASISAGTTGGYSSNAISTATTTTVKSGAGTLHAINVLGGTAGAIDVYDNTAGSGTKLVPTFTPGSVTTPASLVFDVAFATGLTIVTGAATLLQVSYK